MTPKIHVIHENSEWTAPLMAALQARGAPAADWHLEAGTFDLSAEPPPGVFYNRMSASSHTRGHRHSPEYCACVLDWLELHGRRVLNGRRALELELSKIAQYRALRQHEVLTPRTIAALGQAQLLEAAGAFEGPFITKHNRAGKGLGVRLFQHQAELEAALAGGELTPSVDGVTLLQQYIAAPEPFITRVEFIGRRFYYAVRVDTSEGFELCPADACELPGGAGAQQPSFEACPMDSAPETADATPRFSIIPGFDHPLLPRFAALMQAHDVHVAAFELIVDAAGQPHVYDINTNTNYNRDAEQRAGMSAMDRLADYLISELGR